MPFPYIEKNNETPTQNEQRWFTLDEAAEQLQAPVQTVQDLVLTEKIKGLEQDGTFWISDEELEHIKHKPEVRTVVTEEGGPRAGERIQDSEPEAEEVEDRPWKRSGAFETDTPEIQGVIPLEEETHDKDGSGKWRSAFEKATDQLRKMKQPLSELKLREWIGQFFQIIGEKKQKEVQEEEANRQVSVKLGFMTGKNEMYCDFCEINDRFYPGAIFADVYVDGTLKWMMCPNCLYYCRQQANGSMTQNIRARFNQLAFRLEQEAHRARKLASSEDFQVPRIHEWEAWETASLAMQEVAASHSSDPDPSSPPFGAAEGETTNSGF